MLEERTIIGNKERKKNKQPRLPSQTYHYYLHSTLHKNPSRDKTEKPARPSDKPQFLQSKYLKMACQISQRNEDVHLETDNSSQMCHTFPWQHSRQERHLPTGLGADGWSMSGYDREPTTTEIQFSFCLRHRGVDMGLRAPLIRSHSGGHQQGHCHQPGGPCSRTMRQLD